MTPFLFGEGTAIFFAEGSESMTEAERLILGMFTTEDLLILKLLLCEYNFWTLEVEEGLEM